MDTLAGEFRASEDKSGFYVNVLENLLTRFGYTLSKEEPSIPLKDIPEDAREAEHDRRVKFKAFLRPVGRPPSNLHQKLISARKSDLGTGTVMLETEPTMAPSIESY